MASSAMWLLLVVGGSTNLLVVGHPCRATDHHPYLELGSKTSYQHAHGTQGPPSAPGCRPIQMWMFGRHGTRYPSATNIKKMSELEDVRDKIISNYEANRTLLCKQDVENLVAWTFDVHTNQTNLLSVQGRLDLFGLGHRLASYFPQLLNTSYTPEKFIIRHSDTSRTEQSAIYFAKGVFGADFDSAIPYSPEDDLFIRNYEHCAAWHGRKQQKKQQDLFEESEEMLDLISRVSGRLGFNRELSIKKVVSMYNMCRFNKAWEPSAISPWCAVFNTDELKVMEYWEDVMYYYFNGPGDQINMRLACPIIQHMFSQFSALETNPQSDRPKGFFFFGHENMIDMLDSKLGFTQVEVALKGDNFAQETNRAFRNSKIVPFAANIVAVLYKCSNNQDLKVLFLRSEHPLVFPGCKEPLCDWTTVKQSLSPTVLDPSCSDDSYCNKHHRN